MTLQARIAAQDLALGRITESFTATTTLQQQNGSANASRGFFLAYVNSFNEWHEGSQFEPAKDFADLTSDERRIGYHNPPDGHARLRRLRSLIDGLAAPAAARGLRHGPAPATSTRRDRGCDPGAVGR